MDIMDGQGSVGPAGSGVELVVTGRWWRLARCCHLLVLMAPLALLLMSPTDIGIDLLNVQASEPSVVFSLCCTSCWQEVAVVTPSLVLSLLVSWHVLEGRRGDGAVEQGEGQG